MQQRYTMTMPARRVDRKNAEGQWEKVELPESEETVELSIDIDWLLAQLGKKAIASRGGKSQSLAGAVKVKHIRKK
jgi:hypothetical protein